MARYNHLPLYKTAYDFCLYFYKLSKGFSKDIKYTLAEEIKNHISRIITLIVTANNTYEKTNYLKKATVIVEIIKIKVRLLRDMGAINIRSYEYSSRQLIDISQQFERWKLWAEKGRGQSR